MRDIASRIKATVLAIICLIAALIQHEYPPAPFSKFGLNYLYNGRSLTFKSLARAQKTRGAARTG